ncbi:MAG: amidophosphoribosyltransferase [Candidatus Lokiarchaeota archaeon]|nr:amidophosphoribosyltransferase [Candidatus Lokiarchaeota archaeon]
MKRKVNEECGIIGIHCPENGHYISAKIFYGLISLQHRGQESAGISMRSGKHIRGYKAQGLVYNVFNDQILSGMIGRIGIGHVRYSTTSVSSIENAQPFNFQLPKGEFSLAYNGTLTNFIDLQGKYSRDYTFKTSTDTEVIVYLLSKYVQESGYDYFEAMKKLSNEIQGSYSITIINEKGELFGLRDPLGFKPLCIGRIEDINTTVIASESVALDIIKADLIREIKPGEIIMVNDDGVYSKIIDNRNKKAFCMFEYVYFARPDSIIDNITVYDVREDLGAELAREHPIDADFVVPIPDSGRTAAAGYSAESGIPLCEGLMKNRYVHRTFIMPGQEKREISVRMKLNAVKSKIKGKDIILVDDSIVRSTTARNIISILRRSGVNKIHFRVSCPPIIDSCYMGIDFPSNRQLIAATHDIEEIRQVIGADTLQYQKLKGLINSIGLGKNHLCLACLTGNYPIDIADKKTLENELNIKRSK